MDNLEALIRTMLADGKSTESVAKQINSILNTVEQEAKEADKQKQVRQSYVNDLIHNIGEQHSHKSYNIYGAIDYLILAYLRDNPSWTDETIDCVYTVLESLFQTVPEIINSPPIKQLIDFTSTLDIDIDMKAETNIKDTEKNGDEKQQQKQKQESKQHNCTCHYNCKEGNSHSPKTTLGLHLNDKDTDIIRKFLESL